MKTRKQWTILCGASTILAATAFSQSPPFPTGYSYSSSTKFIRSDYILSGNPDLNINWVKTNRDEHGLEIKPQKATEDPPASLQHRREFTPASGLTARAKFRVRLDHVNDTEGKFGFYSTSTDPFDSDPDYGAYFYQLEGWEDENGCPHAEIWARIDTPTVTSENFLFEYVENHNDCNLDGDVYDLIVEINGTSSVKFHWKRANVTTWSGPQTYTAFLPTGAMRFSAARLNTQASFGYALFRVFEWEVEDG